MQRQKALAWFELSVIALLQAAVSAPGFMFVTTREVVGSALWGRRARKLSIHSFLFLLGGMRMPVVAPLDW